MAATKHYNLPTMATGAVDWAAILNDIVAKVEVGRTVKATAGETLAAGKAFYIKAADSKAYLATYTTGVAGLWQSSSTATGVEGFGQIGGIMTNAAWTWTPGAYLFIDSSSVLTETDPGTGVRAVAYAISATEAIVLGDENHTHSMADMVYGNLDIARMPLGGTWGYTSDIILQPDTPTLDGLIVRARTVMGSTTFTGSGLDDLTYSGTYVGASSVTYRTEIDGVVTGAITAFADSATSPGVDTTVTSVAHGRSNGDVVVITGTTSYNGTWTIENVAADTFDIVTAFVADDATGTWELSPNTFKWSKDGGTSWTATGVAITGAAQTLDNGIIVTFGALTGHTSGDYWDIPVTAFSGNLAEWQNAAGTPVCKIDSIGNFYSILTAGSVPFIGSSGLISEDNSGLFWDNVTKRLGVGKNSPSYTLDVNGTIYCNDTIIIDSDTKPQLTVKNTVGNARLDFLRKDSASTAQLIWGIAPSTLQYQAGLFNDDVWQLRVVASGSGISMDSSANFGVGTISQTQRVEVNGGVRLNTADAKPTADATSVGTSWVTQGGSGVADVLEVCLKSATDTYSWKNIATG